MHLDGPQLRVYSNRHIRTTIPSINFPHQMTVDYSLYLVTDSTMVPETSTFLAQVEKAVKNGATIVQLREKSILTLDFVERAKKVLEITRPRGIPLIINDRIDVALAVDADGVHVGQDDMPASLARKLIGPSKILGVSCGSAEETQKVCDEGVADYVGLGTVYPTNTKNVKNVCGPIGVRKLLQVLKAHNEDGVKVKCVAIGGINHSNVSKVKFQCAIPNQKIDGVAVVSCIMAAKDAAEATRTLVTELETPVPWLKNLIIQEQPIASAAKWKQMKEAKPLVHHITNNVVKNFSANVTLSIGASPIMSELAEEFDDLASLLPAALVINLGTPSPQTMEVFLHGLRTYNKHGKHVIFDPVAAGATSPRLEACKALLNAGHFSVIKGNIGEILAIRKLTTSFAPQDSQKLMQGVDSIAKLDEEEIRKMGMEVATEFQTVVVITGPTNYVFDGTSGLDDRSTQKFQLVAGGHPTMGSITGMGCSLGSVIAAFVAAGADGQNKKKFNIGAAVQGALELYSAAGRKAGSISAAPGTFMISFLDELNKHSSGI